MSWRRHKAEMKERNAGRGGLVMRRVLTDEGC